MQNIPNFNFFQVKKCMIIDDEGFERYTLQFIDISAKIFYDDIKA